MAPADPGRLLFQPLKHTLESGIPGICKSEYLKKTQKKTKREPQARPKLRLTGGADRSSICLAEPNVSEGCFMATCDAVCLSVCLLRYATFPVGGDTREMHISTLASISHLCANDLEAPRGSRLSHPRDSFGGLNDNVPFFA